MVDPTTLKPGDIVHMVAGSPKLAVVGVELKAEGAMVEVTWYDRGFCRARFAAGLLDLPVSPVAEGEVA